MPKKHHFKANKASTKQSTKRKSGITAREPVDYDLMPPVFSLERLTSSDYCLSKLDKDEKAAFADAIFKRRNSTWKEIKGCGRHSIGFEKIARSSIKAPIPSFITNDTDHFLAFRFDSKKPMVGYRRDNIFFVLWFDRGFTLYKH